MKNKTANHLKVISRFVNRLVHELAGACLSSAKMALLPVRHALGAAL